MTILIISQRIFSWMIHVGNIKSVTLQYFTSWLSKIHKICEIKWRKNFPVYGIFKCLMSLSNTESNRHQIIKSEKITLDKIIQPTIIQSLVSSKTMLDDGRFFVMKAKKKSEDRSSSTLVSQLNNLIGAKAKAVTSTDLCWKRKRKTWTSVSITIIASGPCKTSSLLTYPRTYTLIGHLVQLVGTQ